MPKTTKSDLEQTYRNLQLNHTQVQRELENVKTQLAAWESGEEQKEREAKAQRVAERAAKNAAEQAVALQERTANYMRTMQWAERAVIESGVSPVFQPEAFKYLLLCQGPWGLAQSL